MKHWAVIGPGRWRNWWRLSRSKGAKQGRKGERGGKKGVGNGDLKPAFFCLFFFCFFFVVTAIKMQVSVSPLGDLTMLDGYVTRSVGWRDNRGLIVCVKIDLGIMKL